MENTRALHQARMQVIERDAEIKSLRTQLAERDAQLAVTWQPISTMPQNTRCLVWRDDWATPLVGNVSSRGDWTIFSPVNGVEAIRVGDWTPTHWRSLPFGPVQLLTATRQPTQDKRGE